MSSWALRKVPTFLNENLKFRPTFMKTLDDLMLHLAMFVYLFEHWTLKMPYRGNCMYKSFQNCSDIPFLQKSDPHLWKTDPLSWNFTTKNYLHERHILVIVWVDYHLGTLPLTVPWFACYSFTSKTLIYHPGGTWLILIRVCENGHFVKTYT